MTLWCRVSSFTTYWAEAWSLRTKWDGGAPTEPPNELSTTAAAWLGQRSTGSLRYVGLAYMGTQRITVPCRAECLVVLNSIGHSLPRLANSLPRDSEYCKNNKNLTIRLNLTLVILHITNREDGFIVLTRNFLDSDHSNYSLRIIFSCTFTPEPNAKWIGWPLQIYCRSKFYKIAAGCHLAFGQTRSNAIRSADPQNPTIEPNMK